MTPHPLTVTQWKVLLVFLVLVLGVLDLWAMSYWARSTDPQIAGSLGVTFGRSTWDFQRPIAGMTENSPLATAGAKLGDRIVFDRSGDAFIRQFGTDETIGLTILAKDRSAHVLVRPAPDPYVALHPVASAIKVGAAWAQTVIALVLALIVGFRCPESPAMRALSLAFLAVSPDISMSLLPGGTVQSWCAMMKGSWFFVAYVCFVYFALHYPEQAPHMRRAWVRRAFHLYVTAFVALTLLDGARQLKLPQLGPIDPLFVRRWGESIAILSVVIVLSALWSSWRNATGTTKRRMAWIGMCMGSVYASYLLINLNGALGEPISNATFSVYQAIVLFVAYFGLGYAVLRHRLFDFGFVINRAVVYTILSALLLFVFGVTEWAVDKLLHFEGREKNVIFDAIVALGIILSFHRIQHWVGHKVNHTLFRQWHEAAARLRHFIEKAAHISDAGALQTKFIQAVEEFAGASGCAIYALEAGSGFVLQCSTLEGSPASIDANDDAAIELRTSRGLVYLADVRSALPAEIALPMIAHGGIRGLVLLGQKASRQSYRPDEIALLTISVQRLGLDLEGLRVEELERTTADLRRRSVELEQRSAQLEQTAAAQEREAIALRRFIEHRVAT